MKVASSQTIALIYSGLTTLFSMAPTTSRLASPQMTPHFSSRNLSYMEPSSNLKDKSQSSHPISADPATVVSYRRLHPREQSQHEAKQVSWACSPELLEAFKPWKQSNFSQISGIPRLADCFTIVPFRPYSGKLKSNLIRTAHFAGTTLLLLNPSLTKKK